MTNNKVLYPVHLSSDGFFNSSSGLLISLHDPEPHMFTLPDIATGLSNIARFGGQTSNFHSVALHTLLVWHLAPIPLKPVALLHDTPEAYLGDVIKPLKVILAPLYGPIEEKFGRIIFNKYGVDYNLLELIKPYDMNALAIEHSHHHKKASKFLKLFQEIRNERGGAPIREMLLTLLKEEFGQYD
ncbi:hypothetical protein [Mucilaginibacter sp. L196]|uniref:hypothetical protein n=1 Tax=Mucilaginibacter sp. L196 TaxID=1641870 RepID=UPI00131E4CB0|nr:hypothetical protein [Mucilaginibacter sp. L196]